VRSRNCPSHANEDTKQITLLRTQKNRVFLTSFRESLVEEEILGSKEYFLPYDSKEALNGTPRKFLAQVDTVLDTYEA